MRLSRRDLARVAGMAIASSGLAPGVPGRSVGAQTPEASESSPNEPLLSLLRYIPLSLVEENYSQGHELATFGDGALRLATVGVEVPQPAAKTDELRDVFQATLPVPYGSLAQASVRAEDSLSLFEWRFVDVHRSLYTMSSSGLLHVMRGSFDLDALMTAWSANGYQMLEVDGLAVASISAEADLDFETELGRLALASANNAAFLDDGTLLYSPTLEALTAMLQAPVGTESSLGTYDLVEAVVSSITTPLSGASLLPGPAFLAPLPLILGGPSEIEPDELPAPGPLPLMGLVGFVSGPETPEAAPEDGDTEPVPSGSMMVASLKYTTSEEAAIAAKRALLELETGVSPAVQVPFADRFAGWRVGHIAGSETMMIEIDLYGDEGIWLQMIYNRDASFLYS